MRARVVSSLSLSALTALSCLGDDAGDRKVLGGDDVQPVAAAECDFLARCAPDALENFPGGTREACVERGEALYRATSAQYSLEDADGCARWIAQQGCELRVAWPILSSVAGSAFPYVPFPVSLKDGPELRRFCAVTHADGSPLRPSRPDAVVGDGCSISGCGEQLACILDDPLRKDQGAFCGHCRERLGAGSPCETSEECVVGIWCVEGVCTGKSPVGAPCTSSATCENTCLEGKCLSIQEEREHYLSLARLGTTCSGTRDCGPLMACVSQQCVRRPDVGGTCGLSLDCREGLVCTGGQSGIGVPTVNGTCAKLTPAKAAAPGEGCDGVSAFCGDGLICFNNQCVRGAEGDACTIGCAEGFFCAGVPMGVCTTKLGLGAVCSRSEQCATNYCLVNDTSGCERTEVGVYCSGMSGSNGVCSEPPGAKACLDSN